jgi:hypothetical protein
MTDEDCVHLLPPGQCAYCSGSWRRERDQLAAEQRQIIAAVLRKQDRVARGGTTRRAGWTTANS